MINKRKATPHTFEHPRTDTELRAAAKVAGLKRSGKIHINLADSKRAKMAAKHISPADRSKRAIKAAKTRKSRQHLINAKIAKTHQAKH